MNSADKILGALSPLNEALAISYKGGGNRYQAWLDAIQLRYSKVIGDYVGELEFTAAGKPHFVLIFTKCVIAGLYSSSSTSKLTHAALAAGIGKRNHGRWKLDHQNNLVAGSGLVIQPFPDNIASIKALVEYLKTDDGIADGTTFDTKPSYTPDPSTSSGKIANMIRSMPGNRQPMPGDAMTANELSATANIMSRMRGFTMKSPTTYVTEPSYNSMFQTASIKSDLLKSSPSWTEMSPRLMAYSSGDGSASFTVMIEPTSIAVTVTRMSKFGYTALETLRDVIIDNDKPIRKSESPFKMPAVSVGNTISFQIPYTMSRATGKVLDVRGDEILVEYYAPTATRNNAKSSATIAGKYLNTVKVVKDEPAPMKAAVMTDRNPIDTKGQQVLEEIDRRLKSVDTDGVEVVTEYRKGSVFAHYEVTSPDTTSLALFRTHRTAMETLGMEFSAIATEYRNKGMGVTYYPYTQAMAVQEDDVRTKHRGSAFSDSELTIGGQLIITIK